LTRVWPELNEVSAPIREQLECDALYSGYMDRHEADIRAYQKDEALILPETLDYNEIGSLSTEIRQKLIRVRPATLGAASRIPGVTPAAIVALLRYVRSAGNKNAA
jgi:tRNA uridine 5-carboxymethylaminomethyl modification enzyme